MWNDQDKEEFIFYDINNRKILDVFKMSSAYSQLLLNNNKDAVLCSFEGEIIKYNYKTNKILSEKNIKNWVEKEKYDNIIANPAYISKCIINKEILYFGLLNGVVISCKQTNLKKKTLKTIHTNMILDISVSNFDINTLISVGKENKIKLIRIANDDVEIYLTIEAKGARLAQSNKSNQIFYIDESNSIKIISII